VYLLEETVMVGHKEAAELLMKRLDKVAMHAVAINRLTCIGRHLDAAAAMLGLPDEARTYYNQAMEVAQKLRFRPEIALIRLQQTELMVRPESLLRHDPAERATAREYLDFAITEFREMKMQPSMRRLSLPDGSGFTRKWPVHWKTSTKPGSMSMRPTLPRQWLIGREQPCVQYRCIPSPRKPDSSSGK